MVPRVRLLRLGNHRSDALDALLLCAASRAGEVRREQRPDRHAGPVHADHGQYARCIAAEPPLVRFKTQIPCIETLTLLTRRDGRDVFGRKRVTIFSMLAYSALNLVSKHSHTPAVEPCHGWRRAVWTRD